MVSPKERKNKKKSLKIMLWNVNGLRSIIKKHNIVENYESPQNTFNNFISEEDCDFVCLNELKMTCDNDDLLYEIAPNYPYIFTNYCRSYKGRHGVAILSKYEPINVVDLLINDPRAEGRYLQLEFKKFFLVCVYVPNSGDTLKALDFRVNIWDKALLERIIELKKKKDVILCGDMNVIQLETDTYNFKRQRNKVAGVIDEERNSFVKLLKQLKNVFREKHPRKIQYSYFGYLFDTRRYNKGMLLDYFLVSPKLLKKVEDIKILDDVYGSDHLPVILTMKNII